jgi:lysophospholipase L1-like esterase
LVIGDSFADWLAYGLEEVFVDAPEIGIVRKIRPSSGLVRYEAHNDALEWSEALKDTLASEKPKVIVVMLGLNDRQPLREQISQAPQNSATGQSGPAPAQSSSEPRQQTQDPARSAAAAQTAAAPPASDASHRAQTVSYDFQTDKWANAYAKRVDAMIAALKTNGAPVLWVGLPSIRGPRAIGDIIYLNELYRKQAEKAGITYVNIWDGFVDDHGQYTVQGPDFEGQIRRLRSSDGVHFTKYGAEKIAHYIEHDVRGALKHGIPVAAPSSEAPNAEGFGVREVIGPVVPLNDNAVESGELLGAHNGPARTSSDTIATRVLSRGEAIHAPQGRADNFSWPRGDPNASIPTTVEVVPVAPVSSGSTAPPASAAKDAGSKNAAKRPTDVKKGVAPDAASVRPRRSDSASQPPPLRTAPAAANARPNGQHTQAAGR